MSPRRIIQKRLNRVGIPFCFPWPSIKHLGLLRQPTCPAEPSGRTCGSTFGSTRSTEQRLSKRSGLSHANHAGPAWDTACRGGRPSRCCFRRRRADRGVNAAPRELLLPTVRIKLEATTTSATTKLMSCSTGLCDGISNPPGFKRARHFLRRSGREKKRIR